MEAGFADGEELFEGAVVGAGKGSFVARELGECRGAVAEGFGQGGVDGFVGVCGGHFADFVIEESGFDADAAVEAELERGEFLDERGFVGRGG